MNLNNWAKDLEILILTYTDSGFATFDLVFLASDLMLSSAFYIVLYGKA